MDDLVFCCPLCLGIAKLGIAADYGTFERSQHRPIWVDCRKCGRLSLVSANDVMRTSSMDDSGRFVPFHLTIPLPSADIW